MDKQPTDVELTYNLTVRRPIRLNLTTFGSPVPELTLYKKQKDSNSYVVFTSKRFDVTLIGINITSVEPEDEGDYRLTATYQIYHNSEEFSIIVNSKLMIKSCMGSVFHTRYAAYITTTS